MNDENNSAQEQGRQAGQEAKEENSNSGGLLDLSSPVPASKDGDGRPDGLDAALWDSESKTFNGQALYERLTASEKQSRDLREKMGRRGAPPEKSDDYKVDVPADSPWTLEPNDPLLKAAKDIAYKYGLSQGQFGPFVKEFLDASQKINGEMAEIVPTDEEIAAAKQAEISRIGPNGAAVIKAVSEFVRQNIGVHFDSNSLETIKSITATAEGVHFMNQVREMLGGSERIPMGRVDGQEVSGLPSDAEIMSFIGSAEYQKGDAAAQQKVERWLDMRQKAGRPAYLQT